MRVSRDNQLFFLVLELHFSPGGRSSNNNKRNRIDRVLFNGNSKDALRTLFGTGERHQHRGAGRAGGLDRAAAAGGQRLAALRASRGQRLRFRHLRVLRPSRRFCRPAADIQQHAQWHCQSRDPL